MARKSASKNELIRCEYCGELYSVTYKHCPFCNEDGTGSWNDPATLEEEVYYDDPPRRGGKRLAGGGRGGRPPIGRIIWTVISLLLIVAAACIVFSVLRSVIGGRTDPNPEETVAVSTAPSDAQESDRQEGDASPAPSPDASEQPQESQTVGIDTDTTIVAPTDFQLSREDFTFDQVGQIYQIRVTYTPADAQGDITWTSSDPNIASVSWNGTVTAVSAGTVTVTASVAGVGEKSCIVRCNFSGDAPAASTPGTSGSNLSLNREDFTLSRAGESWRLIVSGTSSAVTWQSSNTSVATVGADGTVTAVGRGTCTVTASVDGVTLECIVRCSF